MTSRWFDREVERAEYDDFSDRSGVLEVSDTEASVGRIAHEMEALQASLRVAEGEGDPVQARFLGRTYLGHLDPETLEQHVIEAALKRILGLDVEPAIEYVVARKTDWEKFVAENVALSWLAWASKNNMRALDIVRGLRAGQKKNEVFAGRTGAIHLLTLSFWSQAVTLLAKDDRSNARRFFKRAIELGSQFGTDSHPMISWAYAASFFEA